MRDEHDVARDEVTVHHARGRERTRGTQQRKQRCDARCLVGQRGERGGAPRNRRAKQLNYAQRPRPRRPPPGVVVAAVPRHAEQLAPAAPRAAVHAWHHHGGVGVCGSGGDRLVVVAVARGEVAVGDLQQHAALARPLERQRRPRKLARR